MKYLFSKFLIICAALTLALTSCASNSSTPGGKKASAQSLTSTKNAIQVAQSYNIPAMDITKFRRKDLNDDECFAAYNPATKEAVIYISLQCYNQSIDRIVFTYCYLNGKADSCVSYEAGDKGEYRLANDDINENLYGQLQLSPKAYDAQTKDMVNCRKMLKVGLKRTFKIEFLDKICEEQVKLTGSEI